jgi:hypothetical protein
MGCELADERDGSQDAGRNRSTAPTGTSALASREDPTPPHLELEDGAVHEPRVESEQDRGLRQHANQVWMSEDRSDPRHGEHPACVRRELVAAAHRRRTIAVARDVPVLEGSAGDQALCRPVTGESPPLPPGDRCVETGPVGCPGRVLASQGRIAGRPRKRRRRRLVWLYRASAPSREDEDETGQESEGCSRRASAPGSSLTYRRSVAHGASRRWRFARRGLLLASTVVTVSVGVSLAATPEKGPSACEVTGAAPPSGPCTSFVDGFDLGTNHGGWTFDAFGASGDLFLRSEGGNPDWHLRAMGCCDLFPPALRTLGHSTFTGDYLTQHASRIGVGVRILALEKGQLLNAPLNLALESDNGTPEDGSDDWAAFFHGDFRHTTPSPQDPWTTISFAIPSQEGTLPEGWEIVALEPSSAPPVEAGWTALMEDVAGVSFEFGPPDPQFGRDTVLFYDVAMDNPRIEFVPEAAALPSASAALLAVVLLLRRRSLSAGTPSRR